MRSQQYILVLVTTPLLVALTGQCSFGFSLTFNPNSDSSYNSSVEYDNAQGLVQTAILEHLPPPEDNPNDPKDLM